MDKIHETRAVWEDEQKGRSSRGTSRRQQKRVNGERALDVLRRDITTEQDHVAFFAPGKLLDSKFEPIVDGPFRNVVRVTFTFLAQIGDKFVQVTVVAIVKSIDLTKDLLAQIQRSDATLSIADRFAVAKGEMKKHHPLGEEDLQIRLEKELGGSHVSERFEVAATARPS